MFILHVSFDKRKLEGDNIRRAKEMWDVCCNRVEEQKVLIDIYGERACDIVKMFGESINLLNNATLITQIRKELLLLKILKKQKLLSMFDKWVSRAKMLCSRPLRIVVLGVDGSGKSTLVSKLAMNNKAYAGNGYLGYSKYNTRIANTLLRLQKETGRKSILHFIATMLLLLWMPIEMKSRVARAEAWRTTVIFDRHPEYEIRSRKVLTKIRNSVVAHFVPKPDILVLCDGDPKVIWGRKKELTFQDHMNYKNQLLESFEKSKAEKYIIDTVSYDIDQSYDQFLSIIRNSNVRRNILYKEPEYILFKESEVLKQALEILNIDCIKDNAISLRIRFDKIIKQLVWLIKKSVNRSEMPYFVLDGHKGVFFGLVSKSTYKWLKYVFFRLIRIFASNILRRNEGERFLIVGKCLNTHKMKSDFRFSGKEANLTLTVIKDKEVSKFYLKNRGIYENDRLDTIAGIQKKTSELLLELKERLNVPYIFHTENGKNYYEVTFQKVLTIPSKHKIDLITVLNYSKIMDRVLDQCITASEKDALALDMHVDSYITCIKNKSISERLRAESKGWLEDLHASRHKLQVSHGDFWTENLIMSENTVWAIDFDRMSVLPEWYDAVHYIIQLSALVYKGITGWFDEITKTENIEQFYTQLLSRQDHDFRSAVKSFVRKNNILYEELLLAEIWVYRLITIYIASMNRKGVGDEAKIIKFIKIINGVDSSKKGFIYKIVV